MKRLAPLWPRRPRTVENAVELHPGESLAEALVRLEGVLVALALARSGGCKAEAARALGITREGLYKRLRRVHARQLSRATLRQGERSPRRRTRNPTAKEIAR